MIHIPKRFSYTEAYLTLRCNLRCSYCINEYTGVKRTRKELSTAEWIAGLNNIDTGGKPITLGGGEPTIRPDFYEIINNLKLETKIDLLTNGKFDLEDFIQHCPTDRFYNGGGESLYYKSIRISYHVSQDKEELIRTAKCLQEVGYQVGIFGLNHPQNLYHNAEMTQRCADKGIYFFIRDFLGFYDDRLFGHFKYLSALNGNRKNCLCRAEDFLIGPEGNVYRCHRDLYDGPGEIGNILNITYDVQDDFIPCSNYGLCNPCDLKWKLSPDLLTSKCAVEIKTNDNL